MSDQVLVDLESANGPRVIVTGEIDEADVEVELPDGWTVGENWFNGFKLANGSWSYPLVRTRQPSRSYRWTEAERGLLTRLSEGLGLSETDVLRQGLRLLAKREGIK